ncbi:MAG: flippase-like domain-containing protein [Bacilli bacterium]|nr:flippase-like domain-containing protein [Bacilli bacterium]
MEPKKEQIEQPETEKPKKKSHEALKYVLYLVVVLVATGLSLFISLKDNWTVTTNAIGSADWKFVALIIGIETLSYVFEGLIIMVFAKLYTRDYKFHQGLANSLIGAFYNDVTPASTGGQVMQAYTLKKQGIQVSNAASIMVMWFILYQTSLCLFDIVALIVEWNVIGGIESIAFTINGASFSIPTWILITIGFILNISVILMLYLMSFSHRIHNFILHHVVGFLGKIRILKNPDKTRENLRVQVENFKIELRRLQSNVPVTILIIILFFGVLISRYSIPYFSCYAVGGFMDPNTGINAAFNLGDMFHAAFRTSFHQMVTGLIPIPGSAGVSELFFYYMFHDFLIDGNKIYAAQIIWRTATFHLVLLVSGLVCAFYRHRPKEDITYANRETFVNLQFETFTERKLSSDTLYETSQLSRKEIQRKLNEKMNARKTKKTESPKKKNKKENDDEWDTIDIDS